VVADGILQYLPFAALPAPGRSGPGEPLLRRREVIHLPSASVLALGRRHPAGRPPPAGQVAVVADPVFSPDDPRVRTAAGAENHPAVAAAPPAADVAEPPPAAAAAPPAAGAPADLREPTDRFARLFWSRAEAEAIAALADPGRTLVAVDFDASLDLVREDRLRDFRYVHFATHGVVDTAAPALSGLVLSQVDESGGPRPGFLRLAEVYDLELAADAVVLSGCETALGREVRGEGLWGLSRGFLSAGAGQVVASLWRVEDRATARLMERFYRALLVDGERPAAALRRAQAAMLAEPRWEDPYYWAGFVVYGDG
jgi:CHAT domain-containing protein